MFLLVKYYVCITYLHSLKSDDYEVFVVGFFLIYKHPISRYVQICWMTLLAKS